MEATTQPNSKRKIETKDEFDVALWEIVKRSTRDQIEKLASTLPSEQADTLRLCWHSIHTPNFKAYVLGQAAAIYEGSVQC